MTTFYTLEIKEVSGPTYRIRTPEGRVVEIHFNSNRAKGVTALFYEAGSEIGIEDEVKKIPYKNILLQSLPSHLSERLKRAEEIEQMDIEISD